MKFSCIIIAIVFCLISIEGQNLNEKYLKHPKKKLEKRMRKCRQLYYHNRPDYTNLYQNNGVEDLMKDILFSVRYIAIQMKQDASNRYNPGYHDYRSEYNKCEESRKELLILYNELASHLRSSPPPPPPPQIIYIQYPVPATCNHTVDITPTNVNITDRRPPADTNKNWENTPTVTGTDDDGDGSRPVSFKPIRPNRPHIEPPPFDRGSTQEGLRNTSNNKPFSTNLDDRPISQNSSIPSYFYRWR